MNQIIWTASAVADLKQIAERRTPHQADAGRTQRLRREADLALSRFGRALIRNVACVSDLEHVYVLQRGGLRVFFRHDVPAEVVTILKAQDVRTARVPQEQRQTGPGQEIIIALTESLIGVAKEETERARLGEVEEHIFLGRLAALALSQYLRERGIDRVTAETGYMADPHLATLLGLAEVDVAGLSVSVCATVGAATNHVPVPRAAFETGFISDYYVFARVAEDLSSIQFRGFITDEELEAIRQQSATSQEPATAGNGQRTTYKVALDQLHNMAHLEYKLSAGRDEPRDIGLALLASEVSTTGGSLTSTQLGEELFGEMPHERACDLHSSWLRRWLGADEERQYFGHVVGCEECRTELFNFMVVREGLEELQAAMSLEPSAELAVVEPHPLIRRMAPEAAEIVPVVEVGKLAVPVGGALIGFRHALARTLFTSLMWARQHPLPAATTAVAFGVVFFFALSAFFRMAVMRDEHWQQSRLPHLVQVFADSKAGAPSVLRISNAQGEVLYTESFPANTAIIAYEKPVDLNRDGDLEVVLALGSRENPPITGRIFVYSFDEAFMTGQRDRPLMAPPFNTYHQLPYSYFPTPWSGGSFVDKLIIDDLLQNGKQRIVLIWRDLIYAGSALTILSLPGKIQEGLKREAEYIHPGHIQHLAVVSIAEEKKILIAGVNNALRGTQLPFGRPDLYYSFIALLDPHQIWGEAPPYWRDEQGKGSPEWYGYFTPTELRLRWPRLVTTNPEQRPEILVELAYLGSGLPAPRQQPYTTIYLDASGQFIREEIGDFPPPKQVTYHLYDSSQVWWLGQDEYERRYEQARRRMNR